jgi:hypothetical protein
LHDFPLRGFIAGVASLVMFSGCGADHQPEYPVDSTATERMVSEGESTKDDQYYDYWRKEMQKLDAYREKMVSDMTFDQVYRELIANGVTDDDVRYYSRDLGKSVEWCREEAKRQGESESEFLAGIRMCFILERPHD